MGSTWPATGEQDRNNENNSSKRARVFSFPGRHQNGAAAVYCKSRVYRDNSLYLEKMITSDHNALLFCRPMQLGKTTLLSLAEELFSVNRSSSVDTDLQYSPPEEDRNKWFVLRFDFGYINVGSSARSSDEETWEDDGRRIDEATTQSLKQKIVVFLMRHKDLKEEFDSIFGDSDFRASGIGVILQGLTSAVITLGGKLLVLVDEYDLPIRNALLPFIQHHGNILYQDVKKKIKNTFPGYFGFFRAMKASLEELEYGGKIILTGITPIGLKEMSGLHAVPLTFETDMADAVGLTGEDVNRMLDIIHESSPFCNEERDLASRKVKHYFNNLSFPGGSSLYHTALVNGWMKVILDKPPHLRKRFLENDKMSKGLGHEPAPSSVFDVLKNARNLRSVVNMLIEGRGVTGYELNKDLSLEDLLAEDIAVSDYLTLLVHLGVASVKEDTSSSNNIFHITSGFYRENLLEPLFKTLQASLQQLTSLKTVEDLYNQGEDILADFVTSISRNGMAKLMSWAAEDEDNHILELQFQSHIISEAFNMLKGHAQTTQEDILPDTGKRTDVTFSSETCVVILELKQTKNHPTSAFVTKAHDQLSGYVDTRRAMEVVANERPVAGFVVILYNDGANYLVEKSRNDKSH